MASHGPRGTGSVVRSISTVSIVTPSSAAVDVTNPSATSDTSTTVTFHPWRASQSALRPVPPATSMASSGSARSSAFSTSHGDGSRGHGRSVDRVFQCSRHPGSWGDRRALSSRSSPAGQEPDGRLHLLENVRKCLHRVIDGFGGRVVGQREPDGAMGSFRCPSHGDEYVGRVGASCFAS